ncbi:MAG TPA: hypothetical protein PLD62_10660, partial [Candidatus Cloacimonadota bacterium]|nr:hypothetical protein [Candidatus Cloacimonadota bacterium]
GYNEYKKENWELASRYLYLANSEIADAILDICYDKLAGISITKGDTIAAIRYYSYIIDYLPNSSIYGDVLVERINLFARDKKFSTAFHDYQTLYDSHFNAEQLAAVQPLVNSFVPVLLQTADQLKSAGDYPGAVKELFQFTQYPVEQHDSIINEICDLYLLMADQEVVAQSYKEAKIYFDKVAALCVDKIPLVNEKISAVCSNLLSSGTQLENEFKFDEAIAQYQTCFILREDFPEMTQRVQTAEDKKARYLQAIVLEKEGDALEEKLEFSAALKSYQKSATFFDSAKIQEKIFRTMNQIEAEKDPKAFALKIIANHNSIPQNLATLIRNMKAKYGQYTQVSDWKVTYAIGKYKYEIRYDVISPDETFYFAWRIDLLTQKITPSNRISEELIASSDIMKDQKQE